MKKESDNKDIKTKETELLYSAKEYLNYKREYKNAIGYAGKLAFGESKAKTGAKKTIKEWEAIFKAY